MLTFKHGVLIRIILYKIMFSISRCNTQIKKRYIPILHIIIICGSQYINESKVIFVFLLSYHLWFS